MSSRSRCLGMMVFAGAMGVLGGCVDNDISIATVGFVAPDVAQGCIYDATSAMTFLSRGYIDADVVKALNVSAPYNVAMELTNELKLQSTAPVNTQVAFVKSFDVQLVTTGPIGGIFSPSDLSFSFPVPGQQLEPGGSGFFAVQAITPQQLTQIGNLANDPTMPSSITFNARPVYTRAEEEHEGAYAAFPIEICHGCLAAELASGGYPSCADFKGVTPDKGNPCNPAADANITCCDDNGTTVCGSQVMSVSMGTSP